MIFGGYPPSKPTLTRDPLSLGAYQDESLRQPMRRRREKSTFFFLFTKILPTLPCTATRTHEKSSRFRCRPSLSQIPRAKGGEERTFCGRAGFAQQNHTENPTTKHRRKDSKHNRQRTDSRARANLSRELSCFLTSTGTRDRIAKTQIHTENSTAKHRPTTHPIS